MNALTLRDLLQQGIDRRSVNLLPTDYRALENAVRDEERARPRGLSLNRTTISQVLKGTYKKAPEDGTIRAIGWLAGVADEVAFTAAGHQPQGLPFASELPQGIDDLTAPERRAALDMLRVLVAQRQEINRHEHSDDLDPAATSGASGEADEDQEARHFYTVLRYDPREPDLITQVPGIEARDDDDAREILHHGLQLAGVAIDPHSDSLITIATQGGKTELIGLVRQDAGVSREEWVVAKMRKLGEQLISDRKDKGGTLIRPPHWNEAPPPPAMEHADAASEGVKQSDGMPASLVGFPEAVRQLVADLAAAVPEVDFTSDVDKLRELYGSRTEVPYKVIYIKALMNVLERVADGLEEQATLVEAAHGMRAIVEHLQEVGASLVPADG